MTSQSINPKLEKILALMTARADEAAKAKVREERPLVVDLTDTGSEDHD